MNFVRIIFSLLIVSSCYQQKDNQKGNFKSEQIANEFQISIEEYRIIEKQLLHLTINVVNNTDEIVYFPITNISSVYDPDFINSINSGFRIKYFNSNSEIINPTVSSLPFSKHENPLEKIKKINDSLMKGYHIFDNERRIRFWGIRYFDIKENGFILNPHQSTTISIYSPKCFDYNNSLLNIKDYIYGNSCLNLERGYFTLELFVDSKQIAKEILLESDVVNLQNKKIKIFDGIISSDKVPINFDE